MSRPPMRVFAQCKGMTADGARAICEHFEHDLCEFVDGELEFEYEGPFFFVDELVDMLRERLSSQGQAWVDAIDNQDWSVTRYHLHQGEVDMRTVPIDSVLEKYHQE